mmetsp:Transcript_12908/g.32258  ORF Transcript_12908/g.32258 Transcript_12908/m.32258 type:complete len:417 (-) Transcript_12908:903-2153(-)
MPQAGAPRTFHQGADPRKDTGQRDTNNQGLTVEATLTWHPGGLAQHHQGPGEHQLQPRLHGHLPPAVQERHGGRGEYPLVLLRGHHSTQGGERGVPEPCGPPAGPGVAGRCAAGEPSRGGAAALRPIASGGIRQPRMPRGSGAQAGVLRRRLRGQPGGGHGVTGERPGAVGEPVCRACGALHPVAGGLFRVWSRPVLARDARVARDRVARDARVALLGVAGRKAPGVGGWRHGGTVVLTTRLRRGTGCCGCRRVSKAALVGCCTPRGLHRVHSPGCMCHERRFRSSAAPEAGIPAVGPCRRARLRGLCPDRKSDDRVHAVAVAALVGAPRPCCGQDRRRTHHCVAAGQGRVDLGLQLLAPPSLRGTQYQHQGSNIAQCGPADGVAYFLQQTSNPSTAGLENHLHDPLALHQDPPHS